VKGRGAGVVSGGEMVGEQGRVNGESCAYIECRGAFAYDAFEAFDKGAGFAGFVLKVAGPVFFACAENHLLMIGGHGVEEW